MQWSRPRRRREGRGLPRPGHEARARRALKVLPAPFAEDPERMARVEREAQVLASLNHHEESAAPDPRAARGGW